MKMSFATEPNCDLTCNQLATNLQLTPLRQEGLLPLGC